MTKTYKTICKKISELSDENRVQIVDLYLRYYMGSASTKVEDDLNSKSEIILLEYDGHVVGFTTLEFFEREWHSSSIKVVFSGDTIVDREHWGQQSLTFACISRMGVYKRQHPDIPVYWFLIVKGHRTYKYMPVFVKSFFPHWSYESNRLKELAEFLAIDKYGDYYNAETGVLEFPSSYGHLKDEYAHPGLNEKNKAAVRYFLEKNPNYLNGHELVCLCELDEANLKPLALRVFQKKLYME
ncbi:MAG: hypothetical protein H8E21_07305 [Gammaproteobacteria bacterium]|nr:hypothetical protein [Gammaproteobacteria bacterium]MBL6999055.1 hypothetical protein [Gammaproteobacteria bacterium]